MEDAYPHAGPLSDEMKQRIRSVVRRQADTQRLERLGYVGDNIPERMRKAWRFEDRTAKRRQAISDRIDDRRPDNGNYAYFLTETGRYLRNAAGPLAVAPIYPGLNEVSRFMKVVVADGVTEFAAWPTTQHFYQHSDFEVVKSDLRDAMDLGGWGVFGGARNQMMDFRPMPEGGLDDVRHHVLPRMLEPAIKADQRGVANGRKMVWVYTPIQPSDLAALDIDEEEKRDLGERGILECFIHYGSRIVSDKDGVHVMSMYAGATQHSYGVLSNSISAMGGVIAPPDDPAFGHFGKPNPEFLLMTSVAHGGSEIRNSWFGGQYGNFERTGYGYSASDPSQHRIYTESQMDAVNFVTQLFEPLFKRNLDLLSLPAYFRLQVDAVEDLDASEVPGNTPRPDSTKTTAKGRKASNKWTVVKALRKPMKREAYLGNGGHRTRAEPDHQVEVAGFWRRLRETSIGRGPDGIPVAGRTWVQAHLRYRDKPEPEKSKTKVKEPVAPYLGGRM